MQFQFGILLLVLCTFCAARSAKTKDDLEKLSKIAHDECKKTHSITNDELKAMESTESAPILTPAMKCFLKCYYDKFYSFEKTDDKKVMLKKVENVFLELYKDDAAKKKEIIDTLKTCGEKIPNGNDCEVAAQMYTCFMESTQKQKKP